MSAADECILAGRALALYDFEATEPNQLAFRADDWIVVVKQEASGWWSGHHVDQSPDQMGWFPASVDTHGHLSIIPLTHQLTDCTDCTPSLTHPLTHPPTHSITHDSTWKCRRWSRLHRPICRYVHSLKESEKAIDISPHSDRIINHHHHHHHHHAWGVEQTTNSRHPPIIFRSTRIGKHSPRTTNKSTTYIVPRARVHGVVPRPW